MDDDYKLALQLNEEWNYDESSCNKPKECIEKPLSIVDPSWEMIDPIPDIRELFVEFNSAYFSGMLAGVEVKWSAKMTLCAGLCCYEGRGGLCSIKLSSPLLKLRPRKDLVETLLHEMIHALLFVTDNNKDHDGHGAEFHKHMYRINNSTGTNISVYHSFHDEVNNYRQHWWRCDGPCVKWSPYYGIVRRAMNRAPSPRDTWWSRHQQKCGGTYTKIKEPENYGKKKVKNTKKSKNVDSSTDTSNTISSYFKKNSSDKTNSMSDQSIVNSSSVRDSNHLSKDPFWNNKKTVNPNVQGVSKIDGEKVLGNKLPVEINPFSGTGFKLCNEPVKYCNDAINDDPVELRTRLLKRLETANINVSTKKRKLNDQTNKVSVKIEVSKTVKHIPPVKTDKNIPAVKTVKNIPPVETDKHIPPVKTDKNIPPVMTDKLIFPNSKIIYADQNKETKPQVICLDDSFTDKRIGTVNLVNCPACPLKVAEHELNEHLDRCLS